MFSVSQQGLRTLKSGNYLYKISLSTDVLNFMFEVLACPIEFLIIHVHLIINLSLIINDLKLAQTGKF